VRNRSKHLRLRRGKSALDHSEHGQHRKRKLHNCLKSKFNYFKVSNFSFSMIHRCLVFLEDFASLTIGLALLT